METTAMETVQIDGRTLLAASVFLPLEARGLPLGIHSMARRLNARYSRSWSAAQWLNVLGDLAVPFAADHLIP